MESQKIVEKNIRALIEYENLIDNLRSKKLDLFELNAESCEYRYSHEKLRIACKHPKLDDWVGPHECLYCWCPLFCKNCNNEIKVDY